MAGNGVEFPAVPQKAPDKADFAALVESRKSWIHGELRRWCQHASRKNLLLAEQEWFDIAGKADPAKTLWAWAWSRFPELVHEGIGIDESVEVIVRTKTGGESRGYPDARQSTAGRLVLIGSQATSPIIIDDIVSVARAET